MNISYNWLKEYVKFDLAPAEVEKILTSIGLEVEHFEEVEEIPGGLAGVVVAEVLECENHPDSDHLHITKVNAGSGEPLQIVCGAPNVAAGQKVMLATLNTKLTFSNGEEIKIKKSKIRGVESFGMLCAEDELGIGHNHEGIMVLDPSAVPGTPAKDYLNLKTDTLYEIGLTPNRVDAASFIGVARDLSAYLRANNMGGELTLPSVEEFEAKLAAAPKEGAVKVTVNAKEAAPRYSGLTIKNVKVTESPDWLKSKLMTIGLRPINSIVDITNYILMEMGQPMHAFDADMIEGNEVVVDFCPEGTKFVTLDEVERTLSAQDLMICNAKEPMCIGGVFGGLKSGVTEKTVNVFLESAYFNPVSIRKTSKRHTLKTDASFRYERGCDPAVTLYALKRAALLITEIAGGEIVGDVVDIVSAPVEKKVVELDFARIQRFIGKEIGVKTIKDILGYLEMEIVAETEGGCTVKVPTYRVDVYRECDVVEDILRIYGYNNIELPANMRASINTTPKPDPERVRTLASEFMAANGFMEMMNNSLTKSDYYIRLKTYPQEKCVMVVNPLSSDLNCMRQTLLLHGLEVVAYNINRQQNDLKLFEYGNVYSFNPEFKAPEFDASNPEEAVAHRGDALKAYSEEPKFSIFITGNGYQGWRNRTNGGNFFTLKGYLELLLAKFGVSVANLEYENAPADLFAEGLSYKMHGGKEIAVMGTVSKARLKQFGIKQPVFAAEISWNVLLKAVKKNKVQYTELPKFPEVKRDLALLIDEGVSFAELRKTATGTEKKLLKSVALFDVYRGDKIPEGKKQYAISFVLQDPEKTLNDKAVEAVMNKLLGAFQHKHGAALR
ncbi:MAG: phenylalanine--tRNA ligase subunit beta [Bacteroidales bacterium]|nr:phenylalanine--tRNA ligase subunit beta [Bacteroidales bacterium]